MLDVFRTFAVKTNKLPSSNSTTECTCNNPAAFLLANIVVYLLDVEQALHRLLVLCISISTQHNIQRKKE